MEAARTSQLFEAEKGLACFPHAGVMLRFTPRIGDGVAAGGPGISEHM